MTGKTLFGDQVKMLLSSVAERGAQHLTEVETDLLQTNFLLNEAIEKLAASFMAIHAAAQAQQEAVELLLSGAGTNPEVCTLLRAQQRAIGQHVNQAVTGLQFQDMTSQLISRTVRRVTGLREALAGVGVHAASIQPQSGVAEVVAALGAIQALFEEESGKLEGALWKAVRQTHMESGDVELF